MQTNCVHINTHPQGVATQANRVNNFKSKDRCLVYLRIKANNICTRTKRDCKLFALKMIRRGMPISLNGHFER